MVNSVGYEIYVRSFCDSDGDGIGDLKGLISKLDYLNDGNPDTYSDLGVNMIWLMPIFKSPSIHGYDQTDYYTINPPYGTMADFQEFLQMAHTRGIKVIVDLVINHCSDQSTWFIQSVAMNETYIDWFVWTNVSLATLDTNGWEMAWGGGDASNVWRLYAGRPGEYFYAAFSSSQPDLNLTSPAVFSEIKNIVSFWLNRGVDGFRLDAIRYLIETSGGVTGQADTPETIEFLRNFQAHMKSVNSKAFTIGEVWAGLSEISLYYDNAQGVDMCFDFTTKYAVEQAVSLQNSSYIYNYLFTPRTNPWTFFSTFIANHDQSRYPNDLGGDTNMAKMATAIFLTLPGIPFVYYGEEFGMMNSGAGGDTAFRSPMQWNNSAKAGFTTGTPWTPLGDNSDPYNVAAQSANPYSQLNMVKKMINIRTQYEALGSTNSDYVGCSDNNIVTYLRKGVNDGIIVAINTSGSNKNISLDFSGTRVPQTVSVQNLMKSETLTGISNGNYSAYGVSFQPYEVKLLYIGYVLETNTIP